MRKRSAKKPPERKYRAMKEMQSAAGPAVRKSGQLGAAASNDFSATHSTIDREKSPKTMGKPRHHDRQKGARHQNFMCTRKGSLSCTRRWRTFCILPRKTAL